jgi:GntR family transcriptional repressor for pyruvate dehydrogenase complex
MVDLEARGLTKTLQGSGTYVESTPSLELARSMTLLLRLEKHSLNDLMLVRKALESVTVYYAALNAQSKHRKALKKCLEEMSIIVKDGLYSEEHFYDYSNHDMELHLIISEASHNGPAHTLLTAIIPMVKTGRVELIKRLGSFDEFRSQAEMQAIQHAEHEGLVEAILRRDAEMAQALMEAHLDQVARFISKYG